MSSVESAHASLKSRLLELRLLWLSCAISALGTKRSNCACLVNSATDLKRTCRSSPMMSRAHSECVGKRSVLMDAPRYFPLIGADWVSSNLDRYERIAPLYDLLDLPFEYSRYRKIRPLLFQGSRDGCWMRVLELVEIFSFTH